MKKVSKELGALSQNALQSRLEDLQKELLKFKVQVSTGSSTVNPGKMKQAKKNIARILSLINKRKEESL